MTFVISRNFLGNYNHQRSDLKADYSIILVLVLNVNYFTRVETFVFCLYAYNEVSLNPSTPHLLYFLFLKYLNLLDLSLISVYRLTTLKYLYSTNTCDGLTNTL